MKLSGFFKKKNASSRQTSSPLAVIQYLDDLIQKKLPDRRPDALFKEYYTLSRAQQRERLISSYLALEQILLSRNPSQNRKKSLFDEVIQAFPELEADIPEFSILSKGPQEQIQIICYRFMNQCVDRASQILGSTDQGFLRTFLRNSFAGKDKNFTESEYRQLNQELFLALEQRLGLDTTQRIFKSSYERIALSFKRLESFPGLVRTLPDSLVDGDMIQILSKAQVEGILMGKLENLENINTRISQQNLELINTQEELLNSKNQIEKYNSQLESVLETVGEGIVTCNEEGKIQNINQEICGIWGYSKKDLLGKPFQFLLPPSSSPQNRLVVQTPGDSNERVELTGKRKNGEHFPFEMKINLVQIGDVYLFTAAIRDITERKFKQKQLEELNFSLEEKVQERTKELDTFFYRTAHDLRSPLTTIQSLTSISLMDEEEPRKYLKMIQEQAARMDDILKILNRVVQVREKEVRTIPVHLPTIFEALAKRITEMDQEGNFELRMEGKIPETLTSDELLIRIALEEVITNAFHYRKQDIQNPWVKIQIGESNKEYIIHIADNGIGIEPSRQDKIFDMFYKAQQINQGIGLGLYLTFHAMQKLRGSITVESTPGIGSTFRLKFPKVAQ